jgi:hypothetical protein
VVLVTTFNFACAGVVAIRPNARVASTVMNFKFVICLSFYNELDGL